MTQLQQPGWSRWDLEADLIDKAMSDPDFRQDLLFRSREVVERELGLGLPEDIAVVVLNEGPGEVIMVLPNESHRVMGSLSILGTRGGAAAQAWAAATLRAKSDAAWRKEVEANPALLLTNPTLPATGKRRRKRKLKLKFREEGEHVIQIVLPHPSRISTRVGEEPGILDSALMVA